MYYKKIKILNGSSYKDTIPRSSLRTKNLPCVHPIPCLKCPTLIPLGWRPDETHRRRIFCILIFISVGLFFTNSVRRIRT